MNEIVPISIRSVAGAPDEVFEVAFSSTDVNDECNERLKKCLYFSLQDVHELKTNAKLSSRFARINWRSRGSVVAFCNYYNQCVEALLAKLAGTPKFRKTRACSDHLEFILSLCYENAVENPAVLNDYPSHSSLTYGETLFRTVEKIIAEVPMKRDDIFLDLGSGVGQVVLQVAGSTNVRLSWGIEVADNPANYARAMEKEFRRWMAFFGKPFSKFKLIHGDFLDEKYSEDIISSSVLYMNNYTFSKELKEKLAIKSYSLSEGSRIISTDNICSRKRALTPRNYYHLFQIVHSVVVKGIENGVSWTNKPIPLYVYTINRSKSIEFCESMEQKLESKRPRKRQ